MQRININYDKLYNVFTEKEMFYFGFEFGSRFILKAIPLLSGKFLWHDAEFLFFFFF